MPKKANVIFGILEHRKHIQLQWHQTLPLADFYLVEFSRLHSALILAVGYSMCAKGRDACPVWSCQG